VATAQVAWGQPLELLIAAGHGRSYGRWNWVLGYSVPGIVDCAIWEQLAARPDVPTAALVTDVGNDLLYGAPPELILQWVETCLARLAPVCQRLVLAELPLVALEQLAPSHYRILRSILFPWSALGFYDALARARQLNAGLIQLSSKFSAQRVTPIALWYGRDPIHVRRAVAASAWQALLQSWSDAPPSQLARQSYAQWWRLRMRRTHVQRF